MRFCLDTSAYSHFKAGHAEAVGLIASAKTIGLPVVVMGELRSGFRLGTRYEKNERELREFIASPVVRILEIDDEVSELYADIFSQLRKNGTPIPTNDVWIAALACRDGETVLTFDKHFSLIQHVRSCLLT